MSDKIEVTFRTERRVDLPKTYSSVTGGQMQPTIVLFTGTVAALGGKELPLFYLQVRPETVCLETVEGMERFFDAIRSAMRDLMAALQPPADTP